MARPSLARLDLNLLVSLDALLSERSVSGAARRLGLGQPALSAALGRLRSHFGDELLTRTGNRYLLTPLGERLTEQTAVALEASRQVFASQAEFDPRRFAREFVIYGADYSIATVGSAISRAAQDEAPEVRFRFVHHTTAIVADPLEALRTSDGILLPHGIAPETLPHLNAYHDRWVAVVADDHPLAGASTTVEQLVAFPWVMTYQGRSEFTPVGQQLTAMGVEVRVDCVVEGFLALPYFLEGTQRVGLLQERLAARMADAGDLVVIDLPFEAVPLVGAFWWHPARTADPAHRWLRRQVQRVATFDYRSDR